MKNHEFFNTFDDPPDDQVEVLRLEDDIDFTIEGTKVKSISVAGHVHFKPEAGELPDFSFPEKKGVGRLQPVSTRTYFFSAYWTGDYTHPLITIHERGNKYDAKSLSKWIRPILVQLVKDKKEVIKNESG